MSIIEASTLDGGTGVFYQAMDTEEDIVADLCLTERITGGVGVMGNSRTHKSGFYGLW
jgi:hypothetical protein